jgi:hypothetical protein
MNDLILQIYSNCDLESRINLHRIFKYHPFKITKLDKSRIQDFDNFCGDSLRHKNPKYNQYCFKQRYWWITTSFYSNTQVVVGIIHLIKCEFVYAYIEILGKKKKWELYKKSFGDNTSSTTLYSIEW